MFINLLSYVCVTELNRLCILNYIFILKWFSDEMNENKNKNRRKLEKMQSLWEQGEK